MGMTLAQLAAEKQNEYKDEIILANVNGKHKKNHASSIYP